MKNVVCLSVVQVRTPVGHISTVTRFGTCEVVTTKNLESIVEVINMGIQCD